MKKAVYLTAAAVAALALAGCGGTREQNTVGGAAVGAAAGALVGAAATGRPGGAVVGAIAGGLVGGAVGNSQPARRCVRVAYDAYGNQVCTRYVVQ